MDCLEMLFTNKRGLFNFKKLLLGIFVVPFLMMAQNKNSFFEPPKGVELISTDLHIHTVFSDGLVWPSIRVQEAYKEGIELIAITDHLEYQPHKEDIPNKNKNRSYEIAKMFNAELNEKSYIDFVIPDEKLKVVPGVEITRATPNPGHINAVFIKDANKILQKDSLKAIKTANKQGAFVFWNHPMWSQRDNGIARLGEMHKSLIKNKLLHGIEVVNDNTFSEEAFSIALENNLTVLGTSDIHGLTNWSYDLEEGGHRPMTFVISPDKSINEIKKSLFLGKTFVWLDNLLIGKNENLLPVIYSNLEFNSEGYIKDYKTVKIKIENKSNMKFNLQYLGKYSFHHFSKFLEVSANQSIYLLVKTINLEEEIELPFRVLNCFIGPKKNPEIIIKIKL